MIVTRPLGQIIEKPSRFSAVVITTNEMFARNLGDAFIGIAGETNVDVNVVAHGNGSPHSQVMALIWPLM
jgi:hypothetical protein